MVLKLKKIKSQPRIEGEIRRRDRDRDHPYMLGPGARGRGAYKNLTSLGDGIDGINNPRNVAEKREQQTDPKLHLIDESLRLHNIKTKASKRNYKKKKRTYDINYVNRKY
jgi:hypothetical protein